MAQTLPKLQRRHHRTPWLGGTVVVAATRPLMLLPFFMFMANSSKVRDTKGKELGTKEAATKERSDLPEKIRFPLESMRWARAQDRIREIGAYNPTHSNKSDAIKSAKAAVSVRFADDRLVQIPQVTQS